MFKYAFIIISLILSSVSFALDKVTLAAGEWPPFVSQTLTGYGKAAKIVTQAFSAEGIAVEYKWYPWKRAFNLAQDGKMTGTFPWMKNAEREKIFYFSKPIGVSKTVLFHLKSKPLSWKSYDDLKGKSIGGSIGYHYSDEFAAAAKAGKFNYQTAKSDVINLRKLLKGRLDAFACDVAVCDALLQANFTAEESAKITYTTTAVDSTNMYLIVSKKLENGQEIIDTFNKGLSGIKID